MKLNRLDWRVKVWIRFILSRFALLEKKSGDIETIVFSLAILAKAMTKEKDVGARYPDNSLSFLDLRSDLGCRSLIQ
jgi:hypothetical protein